jgi:hypothetical protein
MLLSFSVRGVFFFLLSFFSFPFLKFFILVFHYKFATE